MMADPRALVLAARRRGWEPVELRAGVADMAPLLLGYAPFALVIGAAIADSSAPAAGWMGIWLILGGSAHLATVRSIDSAPALVAIATGLLIHARLIVYSASLAERWRRQPGWFKLVAAPFVIDPTWAAAEARADRPSTPEEERSYYLGASVFLTAGWATLITVGMFVGARLGSQLGLGVTIPLCLVTMVAPRLLDRESAPTVLVAALVAVVGRGWIPGSAMVVAIVLGCTAGMAGASRRTSSTGGTS